MRVAVVSDIHGNRPAFEAVLAEVETSEVDQVWCLGDLVGYGAEPDECVRLARESCDVCLVGNHDLAVRGDLSMSEFSRGAELAARWTQETISDESLDWMMGLEPSLEAREVGLYHASPRDPVWEYVLSTLLAELCLDIQGQRVCLIGHSHVALYFSRQEGSPATGRHPGRRRGDGHRRRRVAAEPRQRGPAPRRRLARCLDGARHRGLDRDLPAHRVRRGRRRARRSGPPGCPTRWPSASNTASRMRRSMRSLAVLLAAATLGLCSALLVGCGDDSAGLIPPADAAAMNDALDRAEQELDAEECPSALRAVADASERATGLPATVDADLRTSAQRRLGCTSRIGCLWSAGARRPLRLPRRPP